MDVSPMGFSFTKMWKNLYGKSTGNLYVTPSLNPSGGMIMLFKKRKEKKEEKKQTTITPAAAEAKAATSASGTAGSAATAGTTAAAASEAEKNAAAEAEAAKKAAAKEKAIAEYRAKRDLTIERFFQIAEIPMPEHLTHLADKKVENITADVRRVSEGDIYFYWDMPSLSRYAEHPLQRAAERKPLLIITDSNCDYPDCLHIPDSGPEHDGIRDIYIKVLHYIRSIHRVKVIGVTGSIGKTSTKEMIEAVIRQHYKKPLISEGNNNSFYAIGRNIQSLKRPTNIYLQEVGASSPRVVEFSARQLDCNMAVYTNLSTPHIDKYGTTENIMKDKATLSDFGREDGLAFVNYDDPMLMAYPFRQKKITYSLRNPQAMYYARNIQPTEDGFTFEICTNSAATAATAAAAASTDANAAPYAASAKVHALGEHNVLNSVVAWAVGMALKLPEDEILAGISSYRPYGMRQNLIDACGFKVFADCYNANQLAIEGSLKAMDQMIMPEGGRRIAVLGDVLSLGDQSENIHRQIGRSIKSHNVDILLCYGNDMRFACEEAIASGANAKFFSDLQRSQLEAEIRQILTPKDVVLFKASHAVNLGSTMDRLFGTDTNESISIGHRQFNLTNDDKFEYYAFPDGASIKTCLTEDSDVTVPSHIEAEVLDEFLEFQGKESTVVRRLAIEKLGKTSFRGKTHVHHVTLPPTLIRIRDGAFRGSGIYELELPQGMLSIGSQAFAQCEELKKVVIPDSVKEFGEDILKDSPQAVVCCSEGSAAEAWAKKSGYACQLI